LKSLDRMNLTSQKLDVRPVGSKLSVQPLDGKRVILREGSDLGRYRQGGSEADRTKTSGADETSGSVKPGNLSRGKSAEGTQAKPQNKAGAQEAKKTGTSERRIRKKDGEPSASPSSRGSDLVFEPDRNDRAYGRVTVHPQLPVFAVLTRRDAGLGRSSGRSESFLNRFYRYYSGGNSRVRSSSSGSSSGPRISSGSSSASRGSSGSSGRVSSGSGSRSSSGGGGSRSAGGGSVRKK
jgi:hypothetical protein